MSILLKNGMRIAPVVVPKDSLITQTKSWKCFREKLKEDMVLEPGQDPDAILDLVLHGEYRIIPSSTSKHLPESINLVRSDSDAESTTPQKSSNQQDLPQKEKLTVTPEQYEAKRQQVKEILIEGLMKSKNISREQAEIEYNEQPI